MVYRLRVIVFLGLLTCTWQTMFPSMLKLQQWFLQHVVGNCNGIFFSGVGQPASWCCQSITQDYRCNQPASSSADFSDYYGCNQAASLSAHYYCWLILKGWFGALKVNKSVACSVSPMAMVLTSWSQRHGWLQRGGDGTCRWWCKILGCAPPTPTPTL